MNRKSNYFIYQVKSQKMSRVSKKCFKKCANYFKIIALNDNIFKIIGEIPRKKLITFLRSVNLSAFRAESMLGSFKDIIQGFQILISILGALGRSSKYLQLGQNLFLPIIKLCISFFDLLQRKLSISAIVSTLLDLYSVCKCVNEWRCETLESIVLAGASYMLPPIFMDFVKRLQQFSNIKLGDDSSIFFDLLLSFEKLIVSLLDSSEIGKYIKEVFYDILKLLRISPSHVLFQNIDSVVKEKNISKFVMNCSNRIYIAKLLEQYKNDKNLVDWSRKSRYISDTLQTFVRIGKISANYETQGREEPNAFVFEGPPGVRKSVVANMVTAALNLPIYSHIVKSTMDGKDWYDSYNNEDIFFMDDVGQQGISQWRTLINMVSAVKMPLDCADASLKDTKFFNSSIIIATTNSFKHLGGLCRNDCISDITALWRRAFVFDFKEIVTRGDGLYGVISLSHFDLTTKSWKVGLPKFVIDKLPSLAVVPTSIVCNGDINPVVKWMCRIIKSVKHVKEKIYQNSQISDELVREVALEAEEYLAEGFFFPSKEEIDNKAVNTIQIVSVACFLLIINSPWFQELIFSVLYSVITKCITDVQNVLNGDFSCLKFFLPFLIGCGILIKVLLFKDEVLDTTAAVRDWKAEVFKYDVTNLHNSVVSISKQVFHIEVEVASSKMKNQCLISGHNILVPAHSLGVYKGDAVYVTVYEDIDKNKRIIEHESVEVLLLDVDEDIAILRLPITFPTPFKKLAKWLKEGTEKEFVNYYLVSGDGACPLGEVNPQLFGKHVKYSLQEWSSFLRETDLSYNLHGIGLCGSVVFSPEGGIVGMHIAGNKELKTGVSRLWSSRTKIIIKRFFEDDKYILEQNLINNKRENSSLMRIEPLGQSSVVSKTVYGKSPLYDVFERTREPANLTKFGKCTVKDVASKSFLPTKFVDEAELIFGEKVLSVLIDDFDQISDAEVVNGNEYLAALNKDSSNGMGNNKNKLDYINYEKGCFTLKLQEDLDKFYRSIDSGEYPVSTMLWNETLKDELRGMEKEGLPRSFRVATIQNQVLSKKFFGSMVSNIIKSKHFNGIMIGTNPFQDWDLIYSKLVTCIGVFAGDVKKWDGGMLPQVQRRVINVILSKYVGPNKLAAQFLLESLIHTLLVVQDDSCITTHSFPSGHFLTAIVNSLVNKYYTAMWYYRNMKLNNIEPTVSSFFEDVVDFVYGDDKLNGIRNHSNFLNAISMRNYFVDLGLDLTTSNKQEIIKPFDDLKDIEFLKRKFVFHRELGRIMCPLDLRTLYSGLSYVDYSKDVEQVMIDKIHNFQREIYLHSNYDELLLDFENRLDKINYQFDKLSNSYLRYIYTDKDELKSLYLKYI